MKVENFLRTQGVVKAVDHVQALRRLTDDQLASELGFTSTRVWRLVKTGKISFPTDRLRDASRFLQCDLRSVLIAHLNHHSPKLLDLVKEAFEVGHQQEFVVGV